MKKVFSTLVVLMAAVSLSFAQIDRERDFEYFPRHEFYLQYGTPSLVELSTTLSPELRDESFAGGETRNHIFTGIPAIGYNFFINRHVAVGIDFGYGRAQADLYVDDLVVPTEFGDRHINGLLCKSAIDCYAFHISATYTYWEGPSMEMSGAVYLGVNYKQEKLVTDYSDIIEPSTGVGFSYHLTAMKFRYGEAIGGFVELGFGCRGLVNLGLSIKI